MTAATTEKRPFNLTFEIGTEEIPSGPLYSAHGQIGKLATEALNSARLTYGEVRVYSTPRRLILMVTSLAQETEASSLRVKGPSVSAAYDADGNPTKALEGFARSKGISLDDLTRVEENGAEYVYAIIENEAKPTIDILPDLLGKLITSIDWKKSQRWGSGDERFVRPVRWLLALYGQQVVPVRFGDLTAGRMSRGHRLLAPGEFSVAAAEGLVPSLENVYVIPQIEYRENAINAGITEIEKELGAKAIVPANVFAEVVNLVEYPSVVCGTFDREFLAVPREIITDAMLSHQRYFPLEDADGNLINRFIVVHNGDPEQNAQITAGHERVIRARLSDAAFFYHEDLKRPLDEYVGDLQNVVFQEKLGTVGDKVNRMMGLTGELGQIANLDESQIMQSLRATLLAKADLVTSAVVEFTSLQGVMGGYYAKAAGESDDVALAIPQHYRPRFAGDELPSNIPGVLTALSDKLDTITGLFAIGQAPTGSSDPFALRRAAIGVLAILTEYPLFNLLDAIELAVDEYDGRVELDREATIEQIADFFRGRLQGILKDRGYAYDTVDAVLGVGVIDPKDAIERCEALSNARKTQEEVFADLGVAFTRASKISDPSLGTDIDTSILEPAETDLLTAIQEAEANIGPLLDESAYEPALAVLASLRAPIDRFFEDILVMAEDERVRENRLRLLNRFVSLFGDVADFSKIGAKR